jgi:hypothetical protein
LVLRWLAMVMVVERSRSTWLATFQFMKSAPVSANAHELHSHMLLYRCDYRSTAR